MGAILKMYVADMKINEENIDEAGKLIIFSSLMVHNDVNNFIS
jgi:hypothetical protein